jgi:hypothetical protein
MRRLVIFFSMALSIACSDAGSDDNAGNDTGSDIMSVPTDSDGLQSTDIPGEEVETDTSSASTGPSDTGSDDSLGTGTSSDPQTLDSATDSDTNVADDTAIDSTVSTDTLYQCPEETELHLSASGKAVCCSQSKPVFCDENDDGYTGSCWSEGVNCDSITLCGDVWRGCLMDRLPFCDPTGNMICYPCPEEAEVYWTQSQMPVCCSPEQPVFCDENDNGYVGGCWPSQIDCNTITMCNGYWGACPAGGIPACEGTRIVCR